MPCSAVCMEYDSNLCRHVCISRVKGERNVRFIEIYLYKLCSFYGSRPERDFAGSGYMLCFKFLGVHEYLM